MSDIEALYLCNKEKYCAKDGWCGSDCCNHTFDIHFAINDDSIRIFEEFRDRFNISCDEDGRLYAWEKKNADKER